MILKLWDLLTYSLQTLNINIIWANQNVARIPKPYATISYNSIRMPDHECYGKVDANGMRINSSWRRAIVELQFYSGQFDSYEYASRAVSLLATQSSLDKQWELDVSVGHRLMLTHIPELLNVSQWEDRAIYQFEFYYTENITDDAGLIETVIVDGNYPTGDDQIDENGDLIGGGQHLFDLHCHHVISKQPVFVMPVETTEKPNG